jgi:hypothetical protein
VGSRRTFAAANTTLGGPKERHEGRTREGKLKTLLRHRFPLVLGNDLSGVMSAGIHG